jgi:hypothetical protein
VAPERREGLMDPEEVRRRGRLKVMAGVAMLLVVVVITLLIMPQFYR